VTKHDGHPDSYDRNGDPTGPVVGPVLRATGVPGLQRAARMSESKAAVIAAGLDVLSAGSSAERAAEPYVRGDGCWHGDKGHPCALPDLESAQVEILNLKAAAERAQRSPDFGELARLKAALDPLRVSATEPLDNIARRLLRELDVTQRERQEWHDRSDLRGRELDEKDAEIARLRSLAPPSAERADPGALVAVIRDLLALMPRPYAGRGCVHGYDPEDIDDPCPFGPECADAKAQGVIARARALSGDAGPGGKATP
jgi:hypothetical protein